MSQKSKLPKYFKPLFWSYKFSSINPKEHPRTIIVNSLNYGDLKHWRWLIKIYGRKELKKIIREMPASEFREPVINLISLLLGIKNFKYAFQSDKIRAEKGV